MSVSLVKGGNVSLTKQAPGLTNVIVGLGWDARTTDGQDFDLDASAIACGADGKVLSNSHFVFFNNLKSPDGTIEHTGDNLTGEGEGDDEQIKVNLSAYGSRVDKIVFPVSIYEAEHPAAVVRTGAQRLHPGGERGRQLRDRSLRPVRGRLDRTAMVFGELYRNGAEWKFRAIGQGYASGLAGIARDFGVGV